MNKVVRIPDPLPYGSSVLRGFGRGTRLLTPDGSVPVEEIEPGEAVLDPEGRPHFVLWQGRRDLCDKTGPARHAVVIAANTFGPGKPRRDLYLLQDHRVMVDSARGAKAVSARTLVPRLARWDLSGKGTSYHMVVTRSPCVVMAENLPCHSHEPGMFGLPDHPADLSVRAGRTGPRQPAVMQRG